ncbi:ABC transporter ATP-binding protein [Methylobacterium sp. E-045]|uniref:ABC transporter ATP-binding protein n=1 Tax=Methylobacterium sp. E-045 TaxID=2836575 RepID=UPI001FBADF36|nr:ABC transporter ATP-binding protein [Methylobacterium sp. E-045]MCJ2128334.1 ABC transporter ATP-binding protein [Methylobacterium sp. E-045]
MSLATEALDVRLGGRAVLSNISLFLERGTLIGLVGPNGAGKTTLLRTLAGLVAPTKGRVVLDGMPLAGIARDARARRIAVLFQGAGAGWPMRVRDLVALGRLPHRRAFGGLDASDQAAVARAMARTDTARFAERTEPTLSSGERMRVLLARALAVEAAWLLADEPITALDPAHQLDAMTLLRSVAAAGTGIVAVLHDLSLAARFCDRIVVMEAGRLVADGHPAIALTDRLLADVFGITVRRGVAPDGTPYMLPWSRSGPVPEDIDAAFPQRS